MGQITADGGRFKIAGTTTDLLFAQHDIDDVIVADVLVTLPAQSNVGIGEHTLSLPNGKIVRLGLDAAVIPMIDPTATSLTDLLDNVVDCGAVGQQECALWVRDANRPPGRPAAAPQMLAFTVSLQLLS
jgi:hypothetical protein